MKKLEPSIKFDSKISIIPYYNKRYLRLGGNLLNHRKHTIKNDDLYLTNVGINFDMESNYNYDPKDKHNFRKVVGHFNNNLNKIRL